VTAARHLLSSAFTQRDALFNGQLSIHVLRSPFRFHGHGRGRPDGLIVEPEIDCVFVNKFDGRDGYGDLLATGRTASPSGSLDMLIAISLA
jgi:hypothetical protein